MMRAGRRIASLVTRYIRRLLQQSTLAMLPYLNSLGVQGGRDLPMRMTWHHLVFDPTQQLGTGEYTFRYKIQTHGMVILKFSRGSISNWREYEVESKLPWEEFVRENRF
jgi:hypothetical protein